MGAILRKTKKHARAREETQLPIDEPLTAVFNLRIEYAIRWDATGNIGADDVHRPDGEPVCSPILRPLAPNLQGETKRITRADCAKSTRGGNGEFRSTTTTSRIHCLINNILVRAGRSLLFC